MKKYNVLLTGNLDDSIWRMAKRLRDRSCNVTIAGTDQGSGTTKGGIRYFDTSTGQLSVLYESGHFDTVVFFFSTKSEISDRLKREGGLLGYYFDELRRHLSFVRLHSEITRFYLITDQRVFENEELKTEESVPHPDAGVGRLINLAEQEIKRFTRIGASLNPMIIRITHMYCPGPFSDFAKDFMAKGPNRKDTIYLSGPADKLCNFISVDDVTDFIILAMEMNGFGIVHLLGAQTVTNAQLREWFETFHCKTASMDFDKRDPLLYGLKASEKFNWYARNCLFDDIVPDAIVQAKKMTLLDRYRAFRKRYSKWLPWIETFIGALITIPVTEFLKQNVVFGFIDARLLYAVLIGCVHGTLHGWVAGILAYLVYCITALDPSSGWDLILNMDNWIPFVFYLLAGGITGYVKSSHELEKQNLRDVVEKREDELSYLQEVHKNTCDVRDMLMEQVVKSKDSYGKIYNMVEKLNSMYSDEIMFRALGIYEDLLDNNSISIYVKDQNSRFMRKLVESNGLKDNKNSINLETLPALLKSIEEGSLFSNTEFLKDYPSYCMPMRLSNGEDLLIIVWNARDHQWNKHYQNLIIIISKLALLSMDKAVTFQESPIRYVDGTIFLKHKEFMSTWRIRRQMRLEKINNYVLFRFASSLPDDVLSERLKPVIRSVDVAGRMKDGKRYIIMTQASSDDRAVILKRLMDVGVGANLATDQEIDFYQKEDEEL